MKTVKDFEYLWSLDLHWTNRKQYWEEDNWTSDDIVAYLAWEDENHPKERLTLAMENPVMKVKKSLKEKVKDFFGKVSSVLEDFWDSTKEFYVGLGKGLLEFLRILGLVLYITGRCLLIVGVFFSPAIISMVLVQALGLSPLWYLLNSVYLLLLPMVYYLLSK